MSPARRLPRSRLLLAGLLALALTGGGWLWLRDSSLVAVRQVTITGVHGPDAAQIRAALLRSARNMTTLDVREDELRMAVAPYAVVKELHVATRFPHGLRIEVVEQIPVAVVSSGGRRLAVASDGTLLRDVQAPPALPTIPLGVPPGGSHVSDQGARNAVALLAAAPFQLLPRIGEVNDDAAHGLVASLRSGPSIYFGDPSQLELKWSAAVAVLGDGGSAAATYIDVSDPRRPVAGAGAVSGGVSG